MSKKLIKIIAFLLLIIFWVNLIYPINSVYADTLEEAERKNTKAEDKGTSASSDFAENLLFSGTTKSKQDKSPEPIGAGEAILMLIPNIFIMIAKVFVTVFDLLLSTFTTERVVEYPGTEADDFINDPKYTVQFTLDKLFFGDIEHLNANFFDFDSSKTDLNTRIKVNVAKWNITMSGIALILLLRSNDLFSN